MPTYPDHPQTDDTRAEPEQPFESERAGNGRYRARVLGPLKRRFTVVHSLSKASAAALESFYAANIVEELDFRFRENGQMYVVCFDGPPRVEFETLATRKVTVRLAEV